MSSPVQAHSTHQAQHIQQTQDCDQAMPACCDAQHTAQTSPSSCQHNVDCQSSQLGVLDLAFAKPQLFFTAIYTPTLHAVPASFDPSNVWRPPQHS
ncbi:hypothetical protein HQN60_09705 [Deefgea piscis]|uniref:Uncharacterized protein n=1 Tax=Deefgea piscis TaxID=2739061 RepID=A0A6M8SYS6_9NEIS|nr:hypothetical protein [Deefgea piscis]QKJ66947.1 hypothetical protein HQN60_09705 [Deefgea piscis]